MNRRLVLLVVTVALALPNLAGAQEPAGPAGFALVDVTVIDGTGAVPRTGMTVVIRDGRIADIRATGSRPLPSDVRVEDMGGRFVIPGLIDAHAHIGLGALGPRLQALRLQLRGGVTTIRDPSGDPRITGFLSRQALMGEIESPDVFYAALMGGPGFAEYAPVAEVSRGWEPGSAPWAREVTAPSDVVRVIAEARGTGATGIKLYRYLSPELARGLAAEAHRQGMRVWSHTRIRGHNRTGKPSSSPSEVVAAGADVLSHANHFACEVMPCASGEERSRAVATVDPAHPAIREVLTSMAARGAILDPTLVNEETEDEPHWLRFSAAVTGLAHEAGVLVVAGTDAPMPTEEGSLPRLHEELELLVTEAGLPPGEAIVAATRTAARTIGQEADRGTIEPGKRADLVVLRDDPTADIRNTRTVELVIKGGRVVHDARRATVREAPSRPPTAREDAPPMGDTTRYVQVVEGRTVGSWLTWREGPRTRGYEDRRFDHFPRTEHLELDASGLPVRLEATGDIANGVPWYERFEHGRDTARWFTPRTRGEAPVDGPAFYETVYPAIDAGVLARALLRRASRELPMLPDGRARLEALGERVAEADGRRRTVRLFAVHGVDLYPRYVWLGEEGATFSDEWSVLEGWEAVFPALRARVDEAVAGDRRELAETVIPPPRTGPLVIRGARLFDPQTGDVRDGTTIVVEGERVAAVGPDATVAVPEGAEVLEAEGRMAVPGLWDVHAHLRNPALQSQIFVRGAEALHLAAGVTSVRDMGSHVSYLLALRDAIEAGEAVGPRIEVAGFLYDTTRTDVIEHPVANAAEARALVNRYADMGFPQVKLHLDGSELVRATIGRANEHGMRVVGHLPFDMTSREAVEAGYDEMTHLWWMVWTIPWSEDESIAAGETWQSWHQVFAELSPDSEPVREFVSLLAERGVAVDPTMGVFASASAPPEYIGDEVHRLPPPVARYYRHKPYFPNYFPRSPLARDAREEGLANLLALLPVLHEAGVPILPGTDTWPGFGLHYELELYVEAGIPAPEVLRLATLGAAREMGRATDLGTVEPGKLADLILVDGDPTEDIRDIRRVVTVVKGGKVYDPAAIYRALGIEPCCEE